MAADSCPTRYAAMSSSTAPRWVDAHAPWDASFRAHYHFSHTWDDPGIGADLRTAESAQAFDSSHLFPPATCELGGGMATAYHRRPALAARDVAALANVKIGNGSVWQGYYVFVGGANPGPGLQESHASAYPNDMPPLTYDFHAPVAESGRLRGTHAELRLQHAFLNAFGHTLATMSSQLPPPRPDGPEDAGTLRWAFRGDDHAGFVLINWHQPYDPLPDHPPVSLKIPLGDEQAVSLPSVPASVPAGTVARWPVGFSVGGISCAGLTASVVTRVGSTLVAVEDAGIPVELAVAPDVAVTGATHIGADGGWARWHVEPSLTPVGLAVAGAAGRLLVLPVGEAANVWVQEGQGGRDRRLLLSHDELAWDARTPLTVRAAGAKPSVLAWDEAVSGFVPVQLERVGGRTEAVEVSTRLEREAPPGRPRLYGSRSGRASAPTSVVMEEFAQVHSLTPPEATADDDACWEITWAGDVGQLCVDGVPVSDRFWDGTPWEVNCADVGVEPGRAVTLRILPLAQEADIWLPESARTRLRDAGGDLVALDRVRLTRRSLWRERDHA